MSVRYSDRGALRPMTVALPLYRRSRAVPVTGSLTASTSFCSASRSGENQKPR